MKPVPPVTSIRIFAALADPASAPQRKVALHARSGFMTPPGSCLSLSRDHTKSKLRFSRGDFSGVEDLTSMTATRRAEASGSVGVPDRRSALVWLGLIVVG